ncbi:MAG: GntR family transcriptional regulator [Betaproteobacteria bacterium]|nr:GntR family transcriptional regulator [Betaproteobacteria bacterium]
MSKLKMMYAQSAVPLYIQIASALRHRIETGYWQPRQKISTLEELEREFEVARVTVRLAIELLESEGLVHREQGRGTFVADKVQNKHWLRLETSWESLISPIKGNVPKIIKVDNPPAAPTLAEDDGTLAREYVFLRSLQLKGDTPYAIVSLHLEREIYDSDPDAFLTHTALPMLATRNDVDIERAHQTLVIGTASPETAGLLQVPLGTPTAECHCVVTNREGIAIYVADIVYRSDCIKLYIDLFGRPKSRAGRTTAPAGAASARGQRKSPRAGRRRTAH